MDLYEAMHQRHSVRRYTDRKIEGDVLAQLQTAVEQCNRESGLNIQLVHDEPKAFSGIMAHYGKLINVKNYLALVGKKGKNLDELLGYYGEKLVLQATMLGLDSCWVALTYNKSKCACKIEKDETLLCVISLGYGVDHGVPHRNKPMDALYRANGNPPDWFLRGMEAALLAPTARNQQSFLFTVEGNVVHAQATGGFYAKVDLGIVKYHFEIGAGAGNFQWG